MNEEQATQATISLDDQLKALQIQQNELALTKARRQETYETTVNAIELRRIEAQARMAELDFQTKERECAIANATADENLSYTFAEVVSEKSVKLCLETLGNWSRRHKDKPMELILNSPGGSVIYGLALFDYIIGLRKRGHYITVVVLGYACSMGSYLLQAADRRVIGRYSMVMIHELSSAAIGSLAQIQDEAKYLKLLQSQLYDILAERSTLKLQQIKSRCARKDWWLTAEEALALGFVDEIQQLIPTAIDTTTIAEE